jgi:hypothetical protein
MPISDGIRPRGRILTGVDRPLVGLAHLDFHGHRYVLGRTTDVYAVWDGRSGGPPLEVFPLTTEGWTRAWGRYQELEAAPPEAKPEAPAAPYPLTVGQIVGGGFRLWSRHFWVVVGIAALFLIPAYAIITVLLASTFELVQEPGGPVQTAIPVWVTVVTDILIYLVAVPLAAGAVIHAGAVAVVGVRPTVFGSLRAMAPRIPTLVLITLVAGVAALVPLLPGVISLSAAPSSTSPLLGAGFILLLFGAVPAVFLGIRFLLASSVAVIEGTRGLQPLRRSWALVRGLGWRILGALLLALLVVFAAILVVLIVVVVIVFGGVDVLTEPVARQFLIWSSVGTAISLSALVPFTYLVTCLLYVDARVRKEGLDLPTLAGETGVERPA